MAAMYCAPVSAMVSEVMAAMLRQAQYSRRVPRKVSVPTSSHVLTGDAKHGTSGIGDPGNALRAILRRYADDQRVAQCGNSGSA
jgi:hypothetical protein